MPFKEGEGLGDGEKILDIGEKRFKIGGQVCYDNGDGLEKDWKLLKFTDSEVTVCKAIGTGPKDVKHAMHDGDMKLLTRIVRIDTFILQNT